MSSVKGTLPRRPPLFRDEADFQRQLCGAALRLGWEKQYHTHDSRRCAEGFPDLVLANRRQRRVIYAELKNDERAFTPDQLMWGAYLIACGCEWYGWRFKDWSRALEVLCAPIPKREEAAP